MKPARDLIDWFDETFDARGENEELQAEVAELRAQLVAAERASATTSSRRRCCELVDEAPAVGEFDPVTARVIGRSPTVWYSTLTIDEGSNAGIEVNDAVVNGDGLVGRIREATAGSAVVELITDHDNAVSAEVLPDRPTGIVEPEAGDPDDLLLDFIDDNEPIEENQMLLTAGWSNGVVSSAYPPGIPIGEVSQTDAGEERLPARPREPVRRPARARVRPGTDRRARAPGGARMIVTRPIGCGSR